MVNYSSDEIVSIENFPYYWRISGKPWGLLTNEQRLGIRPMIAKRSLEICYMGRQLRNKEIPIVNIDQYHVVSEQSLNTDNPSKQRVIAQWLKSIPIDSTEQVYCCWRNDVAVIVTWGILMQVWEDLWYPFDIIDVFDESLMWAILIGPEEFAVYIEHGQSINGQTEFNAGYRLVKCI